jgi:hypothetical protein
MSMRTIGWVLFLLLIAVGALMLNYTHGDPESWKHHSEWAKAHDAPAPSYQLFLVGTGMTAVGSLGVGYRLGRPRNKKK